MTKQKFKGVVYLTKDQFLELSTNGTAIINGSEVTYDKYGTIYITPNNDNIKQDDLTAHLADVIAQIPTKVSQLENDSNFATEQYVQENGGKIDSISVNGVTQTIDANKNVNIQLDSSALETEVQTVQQDLNTLQNKMDTALEITDLTEE